MDDKQRLLFEIVATVHDPHFALNLDEGIDDRLELQFGRYSLLSEETENLLHIYFKDPNKVLDLAHELHVYGTRFQIARRQRYEKEVEQYPIPDLKTDPCRQ